MKIEVIKCDICKAEMDPDIMPDSIMYHSSPLCLCKDYTNGNKVPLDVCSKCANKISKLIRTIQANVEEDKKEE